MNLIIFMGRH